MGTADDSPKVRRLRVRLPAQDLDQVVACFKPNLSSAGVFLRLQKDLKPKDPVTVEVLLSDRTRLLSGAGAVSWVGEPSAEGLRGVSCEIVWDADSQHRVDQILARTTIPPPPSISESTTTEPDRHLVIDSIPALAPTPSARLGADEETESDRMPTLRMQSAPEGFEAPGEQAITLDESAETPLAAGFLSPPVVPSGAGRELRDETSEEDLTLESSAPDFAAWADKSGADAASPDVADTFDGDPRQKSAVWRWIKKRLGSNA